MYCYIRKNEQYLSHCDMSGAIFKDLGYAIRFEVNNKARAKELIELAAQLKAELVHFENNELKK